MQTQFQKEEDSFNVSEIVEGGSIGHGTTVPGEFDIDLIIYSRGKLKPVLASLGYTLLAMSGIYFMKHAMDMRAAMQLKCSLYYNLDISGRDVLDSRELFTPWLRKLHSFLQKTLGDTYDFIKMTNRSVQFTYKDKVEVDVDLLVSPFWNNKDEFYTFLLRGDN